jgi:hypothetical protein
MTVFYDMRCVRCMRKLIVTRDVANRVACGRTFVMCVPCADEWSGSREASEALEQLRLELVADDEVGSEAQTQPPITAA